MGGRIVSGGNALLVVTPRLDAPGGIAAVVNTLLDGGLRAMYDCRVVETVGSGSAVTRGLQSAVGVAAALVSVARLPARSVVHLHMSHGGSFTRKVFIARFARLRGHRVVLHVHGSRFHIFAADPGRAVRVRGALEAADRVVVLSATWARRIRAVAPAARTVVVENPIVLPAIDRPGATTDGVLFLGRLGERKGAFVLLEAVRMLQERGERVRLTLAGDGEVERAAGLAATLPFPDDVVVPGWVDPQRVASELLPAHGIFCLPSRDEGQPIALLEAMARGLACVVTAVGGIPDTVTDGVDALVVPVDDPAALADVIGSLGRDADVRVRLGAAARRTAEQRFDVRVCVAALEQLYTELGLERRAEAVT
jgi:glycosyltransferase involved in cell wall biosynthesis